MSTFTNTTNPPHAQLSKPHNHNHSKRSSVSAVRAASFPSEENATQRRQIVTTLFATSMAVLGLQHGTPPVLAQNWGTRSFIKERFFEPGLSPEDAVARIRQTAEGLHSIRYMLETMAWRYIIFYIRLKQAYLSQDLKNAMNTLPEGRRQDYVKAANELVDNMMELDYYVRTPKLYCENLSGSIDIALVHQAGACMGANLATDFESIRGHEIKILINLLEKLC